MAGVSLVNIYDNWLSGVCLTGGKIANIGETDNPDKTHDH